MKHSIATAALSALGDELRLALYRLLVKRGPGGYPAGEIAERLDLSPSNLSFHLKILTEAGLIESRRDGRFVIYSANFDRMNALVAYLTENCCGRGSDCAPRCAPTRTASRRTADVGSCE